MKIYINRTAEDLFLKIGTLNEISIKWMVEFS